MKLKLILGLCFGVLVGCSYELPTEQLNSDELNTTESEEDSFLLGDEEEYEAETSEDADNEVISTLKQLHKIVRLEVAACMGIEDEVAAFEEKKQALIAEGADRNTVRETLKEDHMALRTLLENDREAFEACKESNKESTYLLAEQDIIETCWEKPDRAEGDGQGREFNRRPPPPRNAGMSNNRGPKGGKGHKKGGKQGWPPREFSAFDTDECVAAVESAQNILEAE